MQDNALQAVWGVQNQKRLVSVDIEKDKISIFDTGTGMDGNSICKWGTVGSSSHRDVHKQGVGGNPPFLKPFLGKYGAGGVAAALHLGKFVTVSSKTRESRKVVKLVIEQEALQNRHNADPDLNGQWQTEGEVRDMTEEEKKKAPDGSFTLVEITKLKKQYSGAQGWKTIRIKQLLADIYYPYIHLDYGIANSSLSFPIQFEVNGQNLVEVMDCEFGITNLHSGNGDPFLIDLELTAFTDGKAYHQISVWSGLLLLYE